MDLSRLVHDYIQRHKPGLDAELRYFADRPNLVQTIEHAALARTPYRAKHDHQRRLTQTALRAMADALLQAQADVQSCASFEDLHQLVTRIGAGIYGFGVVGYYDTALRIGAYLGLSPERVYLHAGTKKGARNLGLDTRAGALPLSAFPRELCALGGADLENLLCIYKDALLGDAAEAGRGCREPQDGQEPDRGSWSCRPPEGYRG